MERTLRMVQFGVGGIGYHVLEHTGLVLNLIRKGDEKKMPALKAWLVSMGLWNNADNIDAAAQVDMLDDVKPVVARGHTKHAKRFQILTLQPRFVSSVCIQTAVKEHTHRRRTMQPDNSLSLRVMPCTVVLAVRHAHRRVLPTESIPRSRGICCVRSLQFHPPWPLRICLARITPLRYRLHLPGKISADAACADCRRR